MRDRIFVFIGIGIIVIGVISLLDATLGIDLGRFLCPTVLILLGIWFLIRPKLLSPDTALSVKLLGDVHRRGAWQLADEEIWVIVGDVRLDLSEATIPSGETRIRIIGIVGSVRVTIPEDVGIAIDSASVFTEVKVLGRKEQRAFAPYYYASEGYDAAEWRVRLEITRIVADLRVKRVATRASDTV
jgi:predicted membrane protein